VTPIIRNNRVQRESQSDNALFKKIGIVLAPLHFDVWVVFCSEMLSSTISVGLAVTEPPLRMRRRFDPKGPGKLMQVNHFRRYRGKLGYNKASVPTRFYKVVAFVLFRRNGLSKAIRVYALKKDSNVYIQVVIELDRETPLKKLKTPPVPHGSEWFTRCALVGSSWTMERQ
jgi:hypothetical protein